MLMTSFNLNYFLGGAISKYSQNEDQGLNYEYAVGHNTVDSNKIASYFIIEF